MMTTKPHGTEPADESPQGPPEPAGGPIAGPAEDDGEGSGYVTTGTGKPVIVFADRAELGGRIWRLGDAIRLGLIRRT
jgi:hypothetical protein